MKRSTAAKIPNILTYTRLALVPLFVYLMIDPTETMLLWAAGVYIVAAITDYLDGKIARAYDVVSDTGKLLDPLADKILVMSALIMLVAQRTTFDGGPWVPGWLVVIILAREMWVTGVRAFAADRGVVLAADTVGKWKSGMQMVGVLCLILHNPLTLGSKSFDLHLIGLNLLITSVALALWSGIDYTYSVLCDNEEIES